MATAHDQPSGGGTSAPPSAASVRVATAVVTIEAVLLLGAGAYLLLATSTGEPSDRLGGLVAGALAVATGCGLAWVARGLWRCRRWSRAPAVLCQLLTLPVAYGMVQSHLRSVGVPLIVVALLGLGALFAPATSHALGD